MNSPQYISFSFPGLEKVACIFGTRLGGVSSGSFGQGNISLDVGDEPARVGANRRALKDELGLSGWVELRQVHGTRVHFDPDEDCLDGAALEGDGLGLSQPGRGAVIKTADCQPVMLAHKSQEYVLALHCGWRGNRAGFPETATKEFCKYYNLSPADLAAVRGPSLGPCCARFEPFEEHWGPEFSGYYHQDKKTVDLWSLTRDQLMQAGLLPQNVSSIDMCTMCREELFFSYRRKRNCGRQASITHVIPE